MNAVSNSPGSPFRPALLLLYCSSFDYFCAPPAVTQPTLRPLQYAMHPGSASNQQAIAQLCQTPGQRAKSGAGPNKPQLETGGPAPFILVMFIYPVTGAACCLTCAFTCVVLEEVKQDISLQVLTF